MSEAWPQEGDIHLFCLSVKQQNKREIPVDATRSNFLGCSAAGSSDALPAVRRVGGLGARQGPRDVGQPVPEGASVPELCVPGDPLLPCLSGSAAGAGAHLHVRVPDGERADVVLRAPVVRAAGAVHRRVPLRAPWRLRQQRWRLG